MIKADFLVKDVLRKDERWINRITDWIEFSEEVFHGDLILDINGLEFGVKNSFILGCVEELLLAIDEIIFYGEEVEFRYPEMPWSIKMKLMGRNIEVRQKTVQGGVEVSTLVDVMYFAKEVGKLSMRVVDECLEKFPCLHKRFDSPIYQMQHGSMLVARFRLKNSPFLSPSPFG